MRAMKSVQEHEMEEEAAAFLASLAPGGEGATIVTLSGELGAGKTTFVKGIARSLGIKEHITSPTFVILKIYELHGQKFQKLIHMDAYRLKGRQHLKVLGWDELVKDPGNLIVVEWPEKIEGAIPHNAKRIAFRYSEDGRHILYG
jgi:tRNA threonylcarbamoyladenosine biosynthesis protein TsaE